MKNYYDEILEEIIELKKTEPLKAMLKLQEELNLPYVPTEYEKKFAEILLNIKKDIHNKSPNIALTKEKIFDVLNDKVNPLMAIALQQLSDLNLNAMKREIQSLFWNKNVTRIAKVVVYEYLVSQKVNYIFLLNKKAINPTIEGSISGQSDYLKTMQEIVMSTHKNPSLQKIAIENFEHFSLKTFPPHVPYSPIKARIIIYLASQMLGIKSDVILTSDEIKKSVFYNEIIKNFH